MSLKIKQIIFLILAGVFILRPIIVFAQNANDSKSGEPQSLGQNLQELGEAAKYDTSKSDITYFSVIVGMIIKYFLAMLAVIFLGLVIYGAFLWMTAHGREENVEKARTIIRNATIGVILVIGSYAIVYFVLQALNSSGLNTNLEGF